MKMTCCSGKMGVASSDKMRVFQSPLVALVALATLVTQALLWVTQRSAFGLSIPGLETIILPLYPVLSAAMGCTSA